VAVVTTVELEDASTAIAGARDAYRRGDRFGAADHEAHALRVRIGREHAFRELAFVTMRRAESQAIRGGALHGLHHLRMRVPEDQRAPGHAVVEIAVAVLVDDVRAARFLEEHGCAAHLAEGAHRARNARGNQRFGARIQRGGA
jgi:hypothetical protein